MLPSFDIVIKNFELAMNNAAPLSSPLPEVEQPPAKKAKTAVAHLLKTVGKDLVKEDEATEFVGLLDNQQLNMLFAKIIERKQKESNDKDVVSYQHVRNRRMINYLKIPSSRVDAVESFTKKSTWINRAVEISCATTGNKEKDKTNEHASAKRIIKQCFKVYPEASKGAIEDCKKGREELKILPKDRKMDGLKIATMFKAAQITSLQKRRYLLRHLRHHFGKHAFDIEQNIQKFWDGHSEPHPDIAVWNATVDGVACRGPRKSKEEIAKEAELKLQRKMERQRQKEDGWNVVMTGETSGQPPSTSHPPTASYQPTAS
mmetsp:Transcript_17825/g.22773  ORF Transcript_17825/g.22773 Transcript_17825/m.22773 type:complete len:317 (+) Transcript_17825:12-962(+)